MSFGHEGVRGELSQVWTRVKSSGEAVPACFQETQAGPALR